MMFQSLRACCHGVLKSSLPAVIRQGTRMLLATLMGDCNYNRVNSSWVRSLYWSHFWSNACPITQSGMSVADYIQIRSQAGNSMIALLNWLCYLPTRKLLIKPPCDPPPTWILFAKSSIPKSTRASCSNNWLIILKQFSTSSTPILPLSLSELFLPYPSDPS